jgi:hypothetical protein
MMESRLQASIITLVLAKFDYVLRSVRQTAVPGCSGLVLAALCKARRRPMILRAPERSVRRTLLHRSSSVRYNHLPCAALTEPGEWSSDVLL